MEFTWELLNKYTYHASKEIKMNDYQRMKLQDLVDGIAGPASAIFELETDNFTRPYQVSLLKQLKKKCKLTAEQEKIIDQFLKENEKPRRQPLYWAWTYKIYEGKKMMSGKNEYCGYLHSFYSKEDRDDFCTLTEEQQVGPLTITLKSAPITAAEAYKALKDENGVPASFLYQKYTFEDNLNRPLTLQELLIIWRRTCFDLKF